MVAGGLEVTAQEKRATEPSITTVGTGCNTNSEIPVTKKKGMINRCGMYQQQLVVGFFTFIVQYLCLSLKVLLIMHAKP